MSEAPNCPFCGSTAEKDSSGRQARCSGDAMRLCPIEGVWLNIDHWNRRAPSDREKALVEAVGLAWTLIVPNNLSTAKAVEIIDAALRRYEEEK